MSALDQKDEFIKQSGTRLCELLHLRGALPREELEYLVEKIDSMRDDRLKSAVAGLIGWGDEERAEIETFLAVALEVMKHVNPSKLRNAAKTIELQYLLKGMRNV